MNIHEFIRLPHRFRWGGVSGDDCVMFCATWARQLCGTDPAASVRGTYFDERSAYAVIAAKGGLVRMIGDGIEPLGFVRVEEPQDGDIGVIRAPSAVDCVVKEICAVRFGPLWVALGPNGVAGKRADHVAAWRYMP
ncbi:MAG: hypothetical protein J0H80_10780 [Rhizobiales bacterium]|nr:hypothetical protein [Hyphomicrobiales bacterium]